MVKRPPHRYTGLVPTTAWGRIAGVIAIIGILSLLAASDSLHSRLLQLIAIGERLIAARPILGMSVFVGLAALSAILAFFSSALLVPVAIETWGRGPSMLLLWWGWMLGGVLAYTMSRFIGRPVVHALGSGSWLERFEERVSIRAPFGLILLFQTALPSEVPGYVLGLLRYPFAKYVLALGIAELPFALGTIYLGSSFLERRIGLLLIIGGAGALFTGLAFYALQKRLFR